MKRWILLLVFVGAAAAVAGWSYCPARKSAPADLSRVRFQQAIALYRTQRFAEAGDLFGRCAEPVGSAHAARANYNRGNCAVQQAMDDTDERDVSRLAMAIEHYRSCLAAAASDALTADARHNLEVAKLLLAQASPRDTTVAAAGQRLGSQNTTDESTADENVVAESVKGRHHEPGEADLCPQCRETLQKATLAWSARRERDKESQPSPAGNDLKERASKDAPTKKDRPVPSDEQQPSREELLAQMDRCKSPT